MKRLLIAIGGVVGLAALIVGSMVAAGALAIFGANVNARVAKATLGPGVTVAVFNPQNKIQSQAYFESLRADYRGFLVKIQIQKQLVRSDPSQFNATNLAGIRQECVDAVQIYNAASRSIAVAPFRSADLPHDLNAARCAA